MKMKVKIWIEDNNNNLVFGDGKNEIINCIDKTGSIEEVSKQLNMPEDKVFRHLQILEDNNQEEMVLCIKGLKKNSKPSYILTADAREILQTYQIYQYDVRKFAKKKFEELEKEFLMLNSNKSN